ncbi:hypothetical protein V0288_24425 [Pannus brasiliensis CCIBt3594]|uniref:Sigma-70 family RNA polymerase sigma factor n=1 Tax=Pannus brasiliensis CCIBt3594 TaxID=1427578 RepID=A0AAW9R079_9CHRO
MKRRGDPIEQFSTFLNWEGNEARWLTDNRLRRDLQNYLAREPSLTNPEYWGLFFWRTWLASGKEEGLPRKHLHAYLQEPCYWSAREIYRTYRDRFENEIGDYFTIGVLQFDKILSEFNPTLNTKLSTFAGQRIKWRVIDRLRESDRTFGHTLWSLLLKSSESRFKEALIRHLGTSALEEYLLPWDYYKEIYAGDRIIRLNRQIQKPDATIWQEITERYNRENRANLKSQEIEKRLTVAGQALQAYLSPIKPRSIERSTEEEQPTGYDSIADPSENPLDEIEIAEESLAIETSWKNILDWLASELENIEPARRSEFEMYYGQKLSLQKIAASVTPPVNYTSVLRRMRTVRKKLAKHFIGWARTNLHTSLQSNDIETISEALEIWLEHYYRPTVPPATPEN